MSSLQFDNFQKVNTHWAAKIITEKIAIIYLPQFFDVDPNQVHIIFSYLVLLKLLAQGFTSKSGTYQRLDGTILFHSTKRLLGLTEMGSHHVNSDTTYKMNHQGYHVLMNETTDHKAFHSYGLWLSFG